MPFIVSTINLKGGVGKTTATVALAETLAFEFCKKVLLIDLDTQTNATIMLIGEDRWVELNKQGHTLARLFEDAVEPGTGQFDLDATLQKGVSNVMGATTLDLLPASLDMIDVQDVLAVADARVHPSLDPLGALLAWFMPWRGFPIRVSTIKVSLDLPVALLDKAISSRLEPYDVVLIDCPPNLGCIPLNGLYMSDAYLIPTIPDHLSTYGIPQIVSRVARFSERIGRKIAPLGIVMTKFQANSSIHTATRARLEKASDPPVFGVVIKQSSQIAAAAEFVREKRTLTQKYSGEHVKDLVALAKEFSSRARGLDGSL